MIRVMVVVFVAWILVACGQPAVNPLDNTAWQVVQVNGAGFDSQEPPVLRFGDGTVEGQGFCNSYSAEYQVDGDALTLTTVVATEKACDDIIFNILERDYFRALNLATHYAVRGDELQLLDMNKSVVVLLRKAP